MWEIKLYVQAIPHHHGIGVVDGGGIGGGGDV